MTAAIQSVLEQAYNVLSNPAKIQFLDRHQATAYVAWSLLKEPNYPSALMQFLETHPSNLRLSDTTLWGTLNRLEAEGVLLRKPTDGKTSPLAGRGRPPVVYAIAPDHKIKVEKLAQLWEQKFHVA